MNISIIIKKHLIDVWSFPLLPEKWIHRKWMKVRGLCRTQMVDIHLNKVSRHVRGGERNARGWMHETCSKNQIGIRKIHVHSLDSHIKQYSCSVSSKWHRIVCICSVYCVSYDGSVSWRIIFYSESRMPKYTESVHCFVHVCIFAHFIRTDTKKENCT